MIGEVLQIAVVGAGPAGLASALYLNRAGHHVTVFEAFSKAQPIGAGLMIQPTGMTILHDLGLSEEVLSLGSRITHLSGYDSQSNRLVLDVEYRENRFGVGINRGVLFDVLYQAVLRAGIPMQTDRVVVETHAESEGISLLFEGDTGPSEPFDLVVDASGAHSKLRDKTAPGGVQKPLTYGAFWATLDWCDTGFDPCALYQRYHRASVMVGILPTGKFEPEGKEKAAFFWSLKPAEVKKVYEAGIEVWKNQVLSYCPEVQPYLDQISGFEDLTLARYGHHTMGPPHAGRLVHIGDSAHSTSPQLGQGANMALLDASALAHGLKTQDSVEKALQYYASSRRNHVRLFQALSLFLTPFYQSDGRVLPYLRDGLVSSIARIPPMPSVLASMISGTMINPFPATGLEEVKLGRIDNE